MSGRREQFGVQTPSPVVRYYTWGSEKKSFKYYDKEEKTDKLVFPFKIVFLTSRAMVAGWNDETASAVHSNMVKNSGVEEFIVKSRKPNKSGNTLLVTGIYKNIKGNLGGGHFEKVVFGYEEGVGIVRLNLKGSGLSSFSNFEKENKNLFDNYLTVSTFEELKKGGTKYTVPTFKLGEKVAEEVNVQADLAYKELDQYFIDITKSPSSVRDEYEADHEIGEQEIHPLLVESGDDLPF